MTIRLKIKRWLKNEKTVRCFGWLLAKIIKGVYKCIRWQYLNEDIPKAYWDSNRPFIVAFWHNRLTMTCFAWRHTGPFHMLISAHTDGQVIARTVENHGIHTIAGSSSKGGIQALRSLLKALKRGETIGITPDGPRGPRFTVYDGVISLAKIAKVDILPLTFSTQKRYLAKSWDRLWIPWPWGRGIISWGTPICYKTLKTLSDHDAKALLRKHMIHHTDTVDMELGHRPIPPMPNQKQEQKP